ncbi:general secretion pathway protein GspN [Colwellia sp. MT41]|uniref:Type II secretion system protein N n=1 Tax=Colwellia marinimaniae TaxID=1513592 RepID=A0ABQ0MXL2_9GAMM|nr:MULTISPECIES: type II secretion system protein N [Colwellia]ALO36077.1 general secretion pathway protein GspN [Colwellia sp. MT41]GAW97074.1 type II secretion protein N [Colwellia marinimaniae]
MKKWFAFTAIFLSSYVVFLVATMPLALIINTIELPKHIKIGTVSGSIWQGEIAGVMVSNTQIQQVKTQLSFWSLLSLSPKLKVVFGDTMLAGAEGKFTLTVSSKTLIFKDVELFISANEIAKQLPLPIPVIAQGNVELKFAELNLNIEGNLTCQHAQGQVSWLRSGVVALDNNIKLGKLSADMHCEQGDLIAQISAKNNLGLSFTARLSLAQKKASGQGYLEPGAKFPAQLKSALVFLGRPDQQGRYPLRF